MRRLVSGLAYWLVLGWCCLAVAQQEAPSETEKAAETTAGAEAAPPVMEAEPPLYYLEDEAGELQAVPGFSLEDFEQLYKLKHRLEEPEQPLPYSVQRMSIEGRALEARAELTATLEILARHKHWVRVPVQLGRATVVGEAQYKGPGEHFLHFSTETEGYEVWIRGGGDQKHRVTLPLVVPLQQKGPETRLALRTPRATTSELKLRVPIAGAVAEVSGGGTVETASLGEGETADAPGSGSSDAKSAGTEINVLGLRGDFELAWRKPNARGSSLPVVLESVGTILARIDGRDVNTEATLTVRSYGAPMDRFRVRLPADADVVSESVGGGGEIVPVAEEAVDAGADSIGAEKPSDAPGRNSPGRSGKLIEVRLPKPTTGPVDVRLATRQSHLSAEVGQWFALGGFEVVGAARQWGHVGVAVLGDWHVLWGPSRGVRQVDELPDPLRLEEVVAGFEYFSQPFSLKVRVVPRRTRINVEPEYLLFFEANQVALQATLRYAIRGAKVFNLEIEMPGWEIEDVGPENVVAIDGIALNESSVLAVPLAQPSTGQIELTLRASQPISGDAEQVLVRLPRPRANLVSPATVVVLPADNIELAPDPEATVGLIRQQVAPSLELPPRQRAPLFYRGENGSGVFAAHRAVRERSITVDVHTAIDLGAEKCRVEQELAYEIAYEPADKLNIALPPALARAEEIEFRVDSEVVEAFPASSPEAAANGSEPVLLQIPLQEATIGRCVLEVSFPLESVRLFPETSAAQDVPLVMPADGELGRNEAVVYSDPAVEVGFRGKAWKLQRESTEGHAEGALPLLADEAAHELTLTVQMSDRNTAGSTIVERAWLQTWLTASARQDRAVYRLRTDRKTLELIMPVGVALGEIALRLDGSPVGSQVTPENHVIVPLPAGASQHSYLLEVEYHFVDGRPPKGRFTLQTARLAGANWVRRLYWQLVLPADEHLLAAPAGFSGEYRWAFNGVSIARRSILRQRELESWVGARHRSVSPEGSNCYLFGSLGSVQPCTVQTASRSWIVLAASGGALVCGLLLIYVPASRHPAALFVAGVGLVAASVVYPEPTLLLSQAASLGLALTLLAGFLERSVARRRRRVSMLEPTSSVLEKGSTQTQYDPPVAGSQASTESVPAPMPLSTSDSSS